MIKKLYIFIFLFMISAVGFGQVEFTVKLSKNQMGVNERLRVDFEMNKNGDNFTPPDFDDFTVYAGPRQFISHSWTNGVSSFSKTYTYFLQPKHRGTLTIGQAEVTINGKVYKTTPKTITVTGAVNTPTNGNNQAITDVTDGIHVVTSVSNTHPYLNEAITVVYKLYVRQGKSVSNWRVIDMPKYSNYWSQDISPQKIQVHYGSYDGDKNYRYVVLKKTVLYPQKSGELEIEPITLNLAVEVPTNRRNFFGQRVYKSVQKTLASNSRTIHVKPLPEQGQPANFTGAVGDFDLKVTTSKKSLKAGESLDAVVQVSGKGNLKLFQLPSLHMPKAFEVFDPEHAMNVSTNAGGMHGSISDTYTLIPSVGGDYRIKPLTFSYFDPATETYKTIKSNAVKINVEGGTVPAITGNYSADSTMGTRRQRVTAGKHFRYIKLKTDLQPIQQTPFFKSPLFWILLFLPVVALPLFIFIGKKRQTRANDFYGNRIRRADKMARKYLSEAKKAMGDQKAYYEALERALHNYLKASLDIQTSEISKERILELLAEKQVEEETSRAFISLLESCEFARYTPASEAGMQQDYHKAAKIIAKVDKQLKA